MKYSEFRKLNCNELETIFIEMIPDWRWIDLQRYISENSDGNIFAQVLRIGDKFAITCYSGDLPAVRVFLDSIMDYLECAS